MLEGAMHTGDKPNEFLSHFQAAWTGDQFIRLVLSDYKGAEDGLKSVHVRPVIIKRDLKLSFTYRYKTRDIVKNYGFEEAQTRLAELITGAFRQAVLHTETQDIQIQGNSLKIRAATQQKPADLSHDRAKHRVVVGGKLYLHALGITDDSGQVHKTAQDKYRQIDRYVALLDPLIKELPAKDSLRVVDMGSGKGYLTFALYDRLVNDLQKPSQVRGVEYRQDLVDLCNGIAQRSAFTGLDFVRGTIADQPASEVDILIALHACDTATDDAIAAGIKGQAALIVVAPCCHKQVRQSMELTSADPALLPMLRHGILLERQAEMLTDAIRGLLLEYHGYSIKIFEFIADAHTPKNVMITALKSRAAPDRKGIIERIEKLKTLFGLSRHYLETQLL